MKGTGGMNGWSGIAASTLCGRLLAVVSVAPAAALAAALAAVWPLLALDALRTWSVLLLAVPAAGAAAWLGGRTAARAATPAPAWALVGVVVVGVLAAGYAARHHSEHVVLRRDAGAYALTGRWIAQEGTRSIPIDWAAFGGHDPALQAASPAYYENRDTLTPQFLSGTPLVLAAAVHLGGMTGLLVAPAVVGGLALVAFGGLASRLLTPGAGVTASAALALAYPVQSVMRSTYSESVALLLLMGGLALVLDAVRGRASWGALLAGAVVGCGTLVRVDALREVSFLLPVAGVLFAQRRREGVMLAVGLIAGTLWGAADGVVLARPYVAELTGSLAPLVAGLLVLALVSATTAALWRRRQAHERAPVRLIRWTPAPTVAALLVVLAGVVLALRPHFWVGRQDADSPGGRAVLGFQRVLGMSHDASRTYTEHSLQWVAWWVGWPVLAVALLGAAGMTYRLVAGREDAGRWAPVLPLLLGSSALVLLRPGITPDHPWADRRLVVVVLPAAVLLACAGAWLAARWLQAYAPRSVPTVVLLAASAGLVWFAWEGARPLMTDRTEVGEVAAVRLACSALHPGDVALLVDNRARREWAQVLRGECGVPTANVQDRTALPEILDRIKARGERPVLVAADHPRRVAFRGAPWWHVVRLDTVEDARVLVTRPTATNPLDINLWFGWP